LEYSPNIPRYAVTGIAPRYVKVPNSAVAVDARAELACYPRGSFCLMIFGHVLVSSKHPHLE